MCKYSSQGSKNFKKVIFGRADRKRVGVGPLYLGDRVPLARSLGVGSGCRTPKGESVRKVFSLRMGS